MLVDLVRADKLILIALFVLLLLLFEIFPTIGQLMWPDKFARIRNGQVVVSSSAAVYLRETRLEPNGRITLG